MSDAIEAFYTEHPYPPPVTNLDRARDEWRDPNRHRAEHFLFWPDIPYRANFDILVAGCGTWQAAKYAVCRPDAHVTGIDVSSTSIDYTATLKRQYALSNLGVRQLPIERAADLERQFDLIVCTGVLHHLADPDSGLRALRSVLKPDGVLYLMVYAPYGRAGIYILQDYCRRLGIGTSADEIRDLLETLRSLPQHHPLAPVLRASRDAADPDALADALLNPRDRAYSVPELFDFLERSDLSFSRWYWQAPYLAACGAIASTPHAARLASLPPREQFVAMELWRGSMTTHSVIVRRNDARETAGIGFEGEQWMRFVPIRLPWTQLVQERIPPGAAGVLLNRSHQQHDLILIVDAAEKRLFDAIDGRRSVGEIADSARLTDRRAARSFVERLWQYDQVVFDTTRVSPRTR
jgi:SAM-dependent methyltransferase